MPELWRPAGTKGSDDATTTQAYTSVTLVIVTKIARGPFIVMLPQLAHTIQIVQQNVSIAVGKPVVLKYRAERIRHVMSS